ncbi:MAG: hypothetical protein ACRBG0_21480 [Lewinella sp.]|uniref:hypothetical protein n=1 Tax=Lewinella sp. TaxID=2004506 RepID=UPI003D6AC76B
MFIEVENITWSETGKRVDFSVTVFSGGLFGKGDKECSFKMFALGTKEALERYRDKESELAEKVAQARSKWLQTEGKRYYNHSIKGPSLNVRIWKSKYQTYES